ncbi:flippase [Methanosarcina sp. UBA411]|jgi:O-antigen/teichoic acid export membrane protein|uniref:flippase n=1 Tax=Methanosarcina sp. UBA411 TaxID=1915589 RepID=UPI0025DA6632|nr:flippase [Methanosarcina sp. UBA411]
MKENKAILLRILLVGATNFLLSFSGIILLPILTRNLSIEEYGYWVQIGVTVTMVTILATLGLPFTLVRFLAPLNKLEEISEIFYSLFFLEIFMSIAVASTFFALSDKISMVLFSGNSFLAKTMSFIIFFECLNSFLIGYLRAREQIKRYSMLNVIRTILQIIFIYFLLSYGKGIVGAELGLLASSLLMFFIMGYMIVSEIGFKVPKFENLMDFLKFSIPTVPSNLSNWIVNASDRYVIGYYLGPNSVGYYSPGYALGNILNSFSTPLNFILPATLSKHYDNNNIEEVKSILSYSLKYYLIITIPSFFGLSFLSKSLLNLLTTPDIATEGYLITPFIALSSLFLGVYTIYQKIAILEKKTMLTARIWFIAATLNFLLNILLVPHFGLISAAFTTLIAFVSSVVLMVWKSSKVLRPQFGSSLIIKTLFSSAGMSLVILLTNPKSQSEIFLTIFYCSAVYFCMLYLLKTFEKEEIEFVKSLCKFRPSPVTWMVFLTKRK